MENSIKRIILKMKTRLLVKLIKNYDFHYITTVTFIFILSFFYVKIPIVMGGCREEPRNFCEIICQTIINDNKNNQSKEKYHHHYHNQNCIIRAGVLLPLSNYYEVSLAKALPTLELAEYYIRKEQILPSYVKFSWISYDDRCDASYAAIGAMDSYGKDCVHVFFGPACDFALGK